MTRIKHLIFAASLLCPGWMEAQTMRPLAELVNQQESGWELVQEWIKAAKNKIQVLPKAKKQAEEALYQTQVTTRSPMGAIVYESGGILVDDGWIRILGSGSLELNRNLPGWNKGKSFIEFGQKPGFLLVADDAIGGFFAVNGGAFGKDLGKIYYFAPDRLSWEPLELGYSDFIQWCFTSDLNEYYKGFRWKGWREEVRKMNGTQGVNFYPFLWTKHDNVEKLSRKAVPIQELWDFQMDAIRQINAQKK